MEVYKSIFKGDIMNLKKMEVANFSCKSIIGDVELLDIFNDYVYPAMLNQEVPGSRNSETLSYKFIDLNFIKLDKEILLFGRLVKNLNIKRQQILEGNSLVQSFNTMESAPSSFFVLILSNHKLLWVREVPRAPLLKDFKYAITKMLNYQRSELVNDYVSKNKQNLLFEKNKLEEIERKAYALYPALDINVTQIGNQVKIAEKLARFNKIHNIKITALKRNNELGSDYSAFSKMLSDTQEDMKAKDVVTEIRGDSKHPLNKDAVTRLVQASADGNYDYKIKGRDQNNNEITETSETLSLVTDVNFQEDDAINATSMLGKFMSLTNKFYLLPKQHEILNAKLKNIENKYLR